MSRGAHRLLYLDFFTHNFTIHPILILTNCHAIFPSLSLDKKTSSFLILVEKKNDMNA